MFILDVHFGLFILDVHFGCSFWMLILDVHFGCSFWMFILDVHFGLFSSISVNSDYAWSVRMTFEFSVKGLTDMFIFLKFVSKLTLVKDRSFASLRILLLCIV